MHVYFNNHMNTKINYRYQLLFIMVNTAVVLQLIRHVISCFAHIMVILKPKISPTNTYRLNLYKMMCHLWAG